jgi:hypothetical protein
MHAKGPGEIQTKGFSAVMPSIPVNSFMFSVRMNGMLPWIIREKSWGRVQ